MERKIFSISIVILICLMSFQVRAQSGLKTASFDGLAQIFTMELQDGSVITADNVSQTFYVANGIGEIFEVSFHDVVSQAEPDPSKRAALMQKLRDSLSDPSVTSTLTNSTVPRVASIPPPRPGDPPPFEIPRGFGGPLPGGGSPYLLFWAVHAL